MGGRIPERVSGAKSEPVPLFCLQKANLSRFSVSAFERVEVLLLAEKRSAADAAVEAVEDKPAGGVARGARHGR